MRTKREILDFLTLRLITWYIIYDNLSDLMDKEKDIDKFNKLSDEFKIVKNKLSMLISINNYINGKEDI